MTHGAAEPTGVPSLALSDVPTWRQVLVLGWPALVQQLLLFTVMLYDSWLAGRYPPEQGEQVAAQSAQTTARYLSWFLGSYAVLVTVGSTALVARFIGAGDRSSAIHVTNQSLLLASFLGTAGSIFGLVYVEKLMAALQLQGDA